ncbi:MAG: DUF4442 domain-containing protein [Alysiella sp.]|uniref:DUF4442 domain-containing protein n=1 Tax=Alysiella sp. TaxID=1872483 RepID=UPI0026DABCA0|nr:DUF4442 domain-containing protein [Alysiella sp.]MDO4433905.1 DUF4442 domain-containing protein [Alysiella sp.]
MLPLPRKRPKTANALRRRMNLWPPLLFTGIQITHLSEDYTHCRARLKNWFNTKNSHGSQFGGSLFALTDAIYPVMLGCIYGDKYYVWDKSAHIEFVKPGFGEVYLDCQLTHADRQNIEAATANGEKHLPEFTVRIFDKNDETIAIAKRTLYIRLKKEFRPQTEQDKAT